MHDDHTGHHLNNNAAGSIISENSIQDKLLTTLAALAMIAIFLTGVYWQMSPLPKVQEEDESAHHSTYPLYAPLDNNPNVR